MGQIKNIKLHIVTDIKDLNHVTLTYTSLVMPTSEVLDVGGKQTGNLWNRKIVSDKADGCFLTITNTLSSGGTADSRTHTRFLHVAADLSGDRIIGGDHHNPLFYSKTCYSYIHS